VQLWSLPDGSGLVVGARSAESGPARHYRLVVYRGATAFRRYAFLLAWGERWQARVAVPAGLAVYRTTLYDAGGRPLRTLRVTIAPGGG
jgi:hypothetical protein